MAKGELFKELPEWAKGVIAVLIVGGASFIGYKIYKESQKQKLLEGAKAENDSVKAELDKLNADVAKKQTLTRSQVTAMANAIFAAMDGFGTDSLAIGKQLLQLKNQADWLALSSAYGIRTLSSGKLNPEPDFTGTLLSSLTNELGVIDSTYTGKFNTMFKQRGINVVL